MADLKKVDPLTDDDDETARRELDTVFRALGADPAKMVTAKRAVAAKVEPVMAGLRRILGDEVLDIFPRPLMEAVDRSYQIWLANPDSYLPTQFDTEQEKKDSLHVMRAYAECAPDGPYTIRTLSDENPALLIWRAQTRRGSRDDG